MCRVGRCDDLRFVGLKLIFLIVSVSCRCSRCSRREAWWKDGTGPPNKGYYAEDLTDAWERYSRYIATDEDSSQVSHVADDVADHVAAHSRWNGSPSSGRRWCGARCRAAALCGPGRTGMEASSRWSDGLKADR
jgi:hypothetical protein